MPRARIKKHLPDPGRIKALPSLRYLGTIRFGDPALWTVSRATISKATAIGLFCAYLPMPLEMLPAALLAVFWRANLPLSVVLVWLSNPLTWIFLYTPPYLLGSALLGEGGVSASPLTMETMIQGLAALWLGCLIFGAVLAGAGYFAVRVAWRIVVINTRDKRRLKPKLAGETGRGA